MGAGHAHTLFVHGHSAVHRLAPEVKVASAFVFMVAVATTPPRAVWAFVIYFGLVVVAAAIARLPIGFVLTRLAVIIPFVVFALLLPFIGTGERTEIVGLAVSLDGLWAMWNILAKASIGGLVSVTLAGTTEVPSILRGMTRLRVPAVFTAIAGFMVRYLEVVAGELSRMRVAMTARGHDPRWLWQAKPIGSAAGALFIRSYERGERVYDAMTARGFSGSMPDFGESRASKSDWMRGGLGSFVAIVVATIALVTT